VQRVPTYRPTLIEALGGKPTPAERKVLAAAKAGTEAQLGPNGIRPVKLSAATKVRAELLRFLMLGGDAENPVHPSGVHVSSAWITGPLDLEACESQIALMLECCTLDEVPVLVDAQLGGVYLSGSKIPGLNGQRLRVQGNLVLSMLPLADSLACDFFSTGVVDLSGVQISGQLICAGGKFWADEDIALNLDGATLGSDVLLTDGFFAKGEVSFCRATIQGHLACNGGHFSNPHKTALNCRRAEMKSSVFLENNFWAEGEVDFVWANIVGSLSLQGCRIDGLLELSSLIVGQTFIFERVKGFVLDLDLTHGDSNLDALSPPISRIYLHEARVDVLSDDIESWDQMGEVELSGFQYRSVQSRMMLGDRLALFRRSMRRGRFDCFPYNEYASFLRRSGNQEGAIQVVLERERRLRIAERQEIARRGYEWSIVVLLLVLRSSAYRAFLGYGYRPDYSLFWSVIIILGAYALFAQVYNVGQFAPNSDIILNSTHWLDAVALSDALKPIGIDVPPLYLWAGHDPVAVPMPPSVDYETFGPFLYAVDLFLPLDTIGQTEAWAPSKDRGWWGKIGYYARMPIQLMGWIITALVAALLTGLIGKRDD
jgi:hypothetical protein